MRRAVVPVVVGLVLLACGLAWWFGLQESAGTAVARGEVAMPMATPQSTPESVPAPHAEEESVRRAASEVPSATDVRGDRTTTGAALSVQVRAKETLAPLSDVRILLWPDPHEAGFSITGLEVSDATFGASPVTDASGRARIEVPASRAFRLTTQAEGRAMSASESIAPLAAGEQRDVSLLLATYADLLLFLRVVDDESGAPLPAARARVGAAGEVLDESASAPWSTADEEGAIEIQTKSWSDPIARIEAPDHAWTLVPVAAGHSSRETAREIRLPRAAAVEARIEAHGALALEGIEIVLSTESYHLSPGGGMSDSVFTGSPHRWRALSDAQGRGRIEGLPPNVPLELAANAPGRRVRLPERILLAPGETRAIAIPLGAGALVRGTLFDVDGSPVAREEIWLRPRAAGAPACLRDFERDEARIAKTDPDGRFEFDEVADGDWIVGCSPKGPYAPHSVAVVVEGGRADHEPSLVADASLFIRGRVLDPQGESIQAMVFAVGTPSGCFAQGSTQKDGTFSIGPLVRGSYLLSVMPTPRGASPESMAQPAPVQVEAGASDVVVQLVRGGRITGRVVDALTGAAARADVTLACTGGPEGDCGAWITTSDDGSFDFENLPAGSFTVSARTTNVQVAVLANLRLQPGGELGDLVLRLEPGARLRVRYDGEVRHCQVTVRHDGLPVIVDGVQSGTESIYVVPTGTLTVDCAVFEGTERKLSTKTVDLSVGGLVEVTF